MNRIFYAAIAASLLFAHGTMAQQYVYPIGANTGYQPYYYADAQPAVAQPAPAPSAGNAVPLSQGSDFRYIDTARSGNGTALYASAPAPSIPAPAPTYAAAAPVYAAPAPTYVASSLATDRIHRWGGCYAGLYVGGAFGGNTNAQELVSQGGTYAAGTPYNVTTTPYGYDMGSQAVGGGTLGCNYEMPVNWGRATGVVLGLEGEAGSFSMNGKGSDPNNIANIDDDTPDKTKIGDWDAIAAGRVGLAFDRFLVYGKFGAFFSNAKSSITDNCSTAPCGDGTIDAAANKQLIDAAVGAGLEYALNDGWSLKGEYMYLDTTDNYQVCGAGGAAAAGSNFCSQHSLSGTHMLKVGLNYHFTNFGGGQR